MQAQEELLRACHVRRETGIEDDNSRRDTGNDAVENCDDFIHYFNESSWRRAAALPHGEPLDEARGRVKSRQRHGVFVHRSPVTRQRDIGYENVRPVPDLVGVRDGDWSRMLIWCSGARR